MPKEKRSYTRKQKPILYLTKCECKLLIGDTLYKSGHTRRCPEHGGEVVSSERECIDCDKILALSVDGKGEYRCKKHKKEAAKKVRAKAYKKSVSNGTRGGGLERDIKSKLDRFNIDPRGGYCATGPACQALNELHCAGCATYVPIMRGVDPERLGYFA